MRPVHETKANARPREGDPVLIDLALQGGGSHGAFPWGVLDPRPRRNAGRPLMVPGLIGTLLPPKGTGNDISAPSLLKKRNKRASCKSPFHPLRYIRTGFDTSGRTDFCMRKVLNFRSW